MCMSQKKKGMDHSLQKPTWVWLLKHNRNIRGILSLLGNWGESRNLWAWRVLAQQIHGVGPDPLLQIQLYFGQVAGEHYKGPESVMAFVNSKRLEGGNKRDLEDILSSEDSEPVFIT